MSRYPSLIFALILPFGLGSCFLGPPLEEEAYPYGQPRYGHGGTQSPPPGGAPLPKPNNPYAVQGGTTPAPGPKPPGGPGGVSGGPATQVNVPSPPPPGGPGNAPAPGGGSAGATGGSGGTASTGATASSGSEPPPYGIPVPGKDGMLYSPYKPDAGFIDITTRNADGSTAVLPPGTKIKDPFSGKAILVP